MENTVAFLNLMDLIRFVGLFVTSPIFFGLSVLNILVISFVFNIVIGILLGGLSPRVSPTSSFERGSEDINNDKYWSPATGKSYSSYKELWHAEHELSSYNKGMK